MSHRTLRLRPEPLADLTHDELATVAGGSSDCVNVQTLVPTCDCTGYYPSINAPCTTN